MALRLNGQTSGYVELDAPAVAGSNTLVLPTNNGSSGDYLRTDGSGGLSWVTPAAGLFESYAIICDQKTSTTTGGTFTSGAWRTRDLNTELADADGIVSISSNQFTLGAGSYFIEAFAPAYEVVRHQLRIYNATDAASVQAGQGAYSSTGSQDIAYVSGRVTITGSKAFEIQHQCSTSRSTIGLGLSVNFDVEIYTVVNIFKEA